MDALDEKVKKFSCVSFPFPKIIHQVWINDNPEIPDKWKESNIEWQRLHPDWLYVLWNREMANELVSRHEPEFYKYYKAYPYEIQRIDSVRYCFLKRYGGLYSDLDTVPLKNLSNELLQCHAPFFVNSYVSKLHFCNSFMGGVSGKYTRIWGDLIEECKKDKNWYCVGKLLTIMNTTGPNMMTRYLSNSNEPVVRLPHNLYNIKPGEVSREFSLIKTLGGGSWHGLDSKVINIISKVRAGVIILFILLILIIILLVVNYFKIKNIKVLGKCECSTQSLKH